MEPAIGAGDAGMIHFNRSFVTWTIDWAEPDPVYADAAVYAPASRSAIT